VRPLEFSRTVGAVHPLPEPTRKRIRALVPETHSTSTTPGNFHAEAQSSQSPDVDESQQSEALLGFADAPDILRLYLLHTAIRANKEWMFPPIIGQSHLSEGHFGVLIKQSKEANPPLARATNSLQPEMADGQCIANTAVWEPGFCMPELELVPVGCFWCHSEDTIPNTAVMSTRISDRVEGL
jgi:hypothetical protein